MSQVMAVTEDKRLNRASGIRQRIAVAWAEIPEYAARLIRAGIQQSGPIDVIATRSGLPIHNVEGILGQTVTWVEPLDRSVSWAKLGLPVPDLFVQGGWNIAAFNQLGQEVKRRGGVIIATLDNCSKRSLRQVFAALLFRTIWRKRFDAFWVPGVASKRLLRFWGIPEKRVFTGLYGADHGVFVRGKHLGQRERTFIYVGQLIHRKGLDLLAEAVDTLRRGGSAVTVDLFGTGDLHRNLAQREGLVVNDFLQSADIAKRLAESRFLILPSREEHWGLVVHEAACCGCGIILSSNVASRHDLLTEKNGWCFASGDSRQLAQVLEKALACSGSRLMEIEEESVRLSHAFGPQVWAQSLVHICRAFASSSRL